MIGVSASHLRNIPTCLSRNVVHCRPVGLQTQERVLARARGIEILFYKYHRSRLKPHLPFDDELVILPPRSSFPTSFVTENERLNCLIYASELSMNPSEAANLQMTQPV